MVSNGVPWNRAAKAGMKGHVGGEPILIGGENTCTSFPIYKHTHYTQKCGDSIILGTGESSFSITFVLGLPFY